MSDATKSCCEPVREQVEACGCKAVVIVLGGCCDDGCCGDGCCDSESTDE